MFSKPKFAAGLILFVVGLVFFGLILPVNAGTDCSTACYVNASATETINGISPGNDTTGTGTILAPWATIQKAVDSVNTGSSQTIILADGTYAETGGYLYLGRTSGPSHANLQITIKSASGNRASVILSNSSSSYSVLIYNATGMVIIFEDLTISSSHAGPTQIVDFRSGTASVTFDNVAITAPLNSGTIGIYNMGTGTTRSLHVVNGTTITGYTSYGVFFQGGTDVNSDDSSVEIDNSTITTTSGVAVYTGGWINSIEFDNATITNSGANYTINQSSTVSTFTINDGVFSNATGPGVYLAGTITTLSISNGADFSTSSGSAHYALYMVGAVTTATISGSTFSGDSATTGALKIATTNGTADITINNSSTFETTGALKNGLWINGSAGSINIQSNIFTGPGYSLVVDSTGSIGAIDFSNNQINPANSAGSGGGAYFIYEGDNIVVHDNTFNLNVSSSATIGLSFGYDGAGNTNPPGTITAYNNTIKYTGSAASHGMLVGWGADNGEYYNNLVVGNGTDITMVIKGSGNNVHNNRFAGGNFIFKGGNNNLVQNNTFYNNRGSGTQALYGGQQNWASGFTGATWTESTKTITKSSAFSAYFANGVETDDVVQITAGGVSGSYRVASVVSADAITVATSINNSAGDLGAVVSGTVYSLSNYNTVKNNILVQSGNYTPAAVKMSLEYNIENNTVDYNAYWNSHVTTPNAITIEGVDYTTANGQLALAQAKWATVYPSTTYANNDANSIISDSLLVDPLNDDFTFPYNSPAIDAGIAIAGITTDYTGNPIYGLPDIGAYEYQPPYTMGTHLLSTDGDVVTRVYGDEKFRVKSATSTPDAADLDVAIAGVDKTDWLDVEITSWENSGTYQKTWTASSTIADVDTTFTVGDLEADAYYTISLDGATSTDIVAAGTTVCNLGVCQADGAGQLAFSYSAGYSTHTFDVVEDTTAPTVSLTAPASLATVAGDNVSLTATASDAGGVAGVEFKLDSDTLIEDDTNSPYAVTWDASAVSDGSHTLSAVARDNTGNYATSTVTVTVDNTGPVRSAGSPSSTLVAGTVSTTLTLTTDETATCKYGTTANTAYASIANPFTTTGTTAHSQTLTGLTNGITYTYYVRCTDSLTNTNTADYTISFSVATLLSPSSGVSVRPPVVLAPPPASRSLSEAGFTPAQLSLLRSLLTASRQAPLPPAAGLHGPRFTQPPRLGQANQNVKQLQRFLNNHGFSIALTGPGSPGQETTYFGQLTRQALGRFQVAKGLISSTQDPAFGYLGPKTRAVINGLE